MWFVWYAVPVVSTIGLGNNLIVKSEKTAFLPTVGLTGSYGWNKNN